MLPRLKDLPRLTPVSGGGWRPIFFSGNFNAGFAALSATFAKDVYLPTTAQYFRLKRITMLVDVVGAAGLIININSLAQFKGFLAALNGNTWEGFVNDAIRMPGCNPTPNDIPFDHGNNYFDNFPVMDLAQIGGADLQINGKIFLPSAFAGVVYTAHWIVYGEYK